jgi:hypothetical protein
MCGKLCIFYIKVREPKDLEIKIDTSLLYWPDFLTVSLWLFLSDDPIFFQDYIFHIDNSN